MELSRKAEEFNKLGVRVIAITYDDPADNLKFSQQHQVQFPILTDVDSSHFHRFGIFNDGFEPGHRFYGVPHPGILVADNELRIFAKFAEESYRDRPDLQHVLDAVGEMIREQ